MIQLLSRYFIKPEGKTPAQLRQAYGTLCSVVGISLNILLFATKLFAGLISHSIAITADAFNNLSDAASSVVTLVGFTLAGQKPDADHPFGHGRMEYLSGLAVSVLILLMGIELIQTSVEKILHPASVDFTGLTAAILLLSIGVKMYMAFYNHRMGRKLDATAMLATARDSLSDCAATTAILLASLIGHFTSLHIDGWAGAVVALFILWSGISAVKETVDPLLGTPPSPEFVNEIRSIVLSHPTVVGLHDLIVHDYGPGRRMISLHAEVPANLEVLQLHDEIDNIERELQDTLGCLAVIHMDPIVTDDGITAQTREKVADLARCIDDSITIHDFRMVTGPTHTNLIFDAVVPFRFRLSDQEVAKKLQDAVHVLDGNYYVVVTVERSYT